MFKFSMKSYFVLTYTPILSIFPNSKKRFIEFIQLLQDFTGKNSIYFHGDKKVD